jgi:predicted GIY-YIG superfamily endonuclease
VNADDTHYVYRCYDAEGGLLYIGCTGDVETRLYHLTALCNRGKSTGPLARRMASHTVEEFPNRRAALDAERAAILAESPELNIQGRRKADVGGAA